MATAAFANPVISLLASPPGAPADGDRYLIAPSGTSGAFAGKENQVAERASGAWVFSGPPAAGQQLVVEQLLLQFSAGWKLSSSNVFDTVTALLSATATYGLSDGSSWRCSGRTNAKDGGGAVFCFDASDSTSADNGGTIRVDSAGHRLKVTAFDAMQLPRIFGMKADFWTDDQPAFQAMVNWAKSQNIRDVYLPSGAIVLLSSVFVPYGIVLHGQMNPYLPRRPATLIATKAGATYANDFMIGINTLDNVTRREPAHYFGGGIENVFFWNGAKLPTVKGIIAFGNNHEFRNVGGDSMLQVLKRPGNPNYTDTFHLFNPFYTGSLDPAVAQFEIAGSGDALIIEGGFFPYDGSMAISIPFYTEANCFAGIIRQCINGSMYIDGQNITIDNWHAEHTTLKVGAQAFVKVINSNISQGTDQTEAVIQMVDSIEVGEPNCLELDNVTFRRGELDQFASPCPFEVTIGQQSRLVVHNSRRTIKNVRGPTVESGVRIGQDDNLTPVPGWESYADLLSRNGEIMPGYNVVLDHIIPAAPNAGDGPFNSYLGPYTASPAPAGDWKLPTGTYYYRAVRMYDVENRIGKLGFNPEVSATVANTSSVVILSAYCARRSPAGAGPVQGMTRFYRGTASGSYDAYADVPLIGPDPAMVTDDSIRIAGVLWISRPASGIDTIYPPDLKVPWRVIGKGMLVNCRPIITEPGNAAATLGVASDQQVTYRAALTAARAVTLPALGRKGDRVRVTRTATATGAFNVTIAYGPGGGSTTAIGASTSVAFADFEYNGTYWELVARSNL